MSSLIERLSAFPTRRLTRGDRVYGYRSAGRGPALLLLHGIGSGSGSWVRQLDSLAKRFRVIAWDTPGYGESTPLTPPAPGAADYAAALADFMTGLKLAQAHLVGHSLGALIVTAYARRHPGRVASLTLADPAGGYGAADARLRERKLQTRLQQMAQLGPAGLAVERAPALLSADASAEALALVRWNMRRLKPSGYVQAARLLAGADLAADAAAFPDPVLVLCGSEDGVTPEADVRRLAAAFADARYRSLPGAGHASYIETPEAFQRELTAFIEERLRT